MKKKKLNYQFHDSVVAVEYILKMFVKANQKKVEAVIGEASAEEHVSEKEAETDMEKI